MNKSFLTIMATAVAELELHTKAGWFGMDRPKNGRLAEW